ncbi:MAG TPA: zinc ribbon domain-containing protein [Planctomycetota bacterium]|nr:zinc ribbon domain-containing protein [Planctomycetota bacterium]HRR81512.1 zinc ribbon domain-containing protein [Planctomycetota bacterium]HRT92964.1 zinc ribbon domain-containing protein [Planctomycetota bacterium]
MPIYEFHCDRCDAEFEQLFRSMESAPRATCPSCGGSRTHRKLSLFGMSTGGRRESAPEARPSGRSGCSSCVRSSCAGCRR